MRAVSENDVGTGIDTAVGKGMNIAAPLTVEHFFPERNVFVLHTFRPAVEGHYNDVRLPFQRVDKFLGSIKIENGRAHRTVAEGADADGKIVSNDGRHHVCLADTGIVDAGLVECADS